MGYSLGIGSLNNSIIRINSTDGADTTNVDYSVNGSVKWINLNVKHRENYYVTDGSWGVSKGILGHSSPIYIRLSKSTNTGDGTSGNPYTIPGFYDGGTFYVSLSANDEADTGVVEIPRPMHRLRTYTIPRIGLYTTSRPLVDSYRGSKTSPLEFSANLSSGKFIIQGISKCVHTSYETFNLRFNRTIYKENTDNRYTYGSSGTSIDSVNLGNVNGYINFAYSYPETFTTDKASETIKRNISFGDYTWNLTRDNISKVLPENQDGNLCNLTFYETSNKYDSRDDNGVSSKFRTLSAYAVVFYRPRLAVSESSVVYNKDSSTGPTIAGNNNIYYYTKSMKYVCVSWSYDTTLARSGYTKGYRVELIDKDKTTVVNTYYTSNKYVNIPIEDIPKINETYIRITPYYISSSNEYWYQELQENVIIPFVRLVGRLETPVITYPIDTSKWINDNYRVCFELPEDPDESYIDDYKYRNIELCINDTVIRITDSNNLTTGNYITNILEPTVFSSLLENLTYKRKLIMFPNITSQIPTSDSYAIKVRVEKNYGDLTRAENWSEWSDTVTINVTKSTFNVERGDLVKAEHYNYVLDKVDNVRKTYGVDWSDNLPDNVYRLSTIIKANQYLYIKMFKKVYETKSVVNEYGTFDKDRENVKFDVDDNVFTSEQIANIVVVPAEPILTDIPSDLQQDEILKDDVEGNLIVVLPTRLEDTHYITALRDKQLSITESYVDDNKQQGVRTVLKDGKNYIKYVDEDCEALK